MAKETVELYFDGVLHECKLTENPKDELGELLYVADNGRFAKFPDDENLEENIEKFNEANSEEVEIVEEKVYENVITFDKDGNEVK